MASVALIEDDQRIRAALVRSLAERGHTVRAAGRAMEGLTQVLEWHPDVVDGSGATGAVTTVAGGVAAAPAGGSTRAPAVAPGRGRELAGDAWAGDDVAPAEGRAGAASVGGDGGGTAVSGAGVTGSATSPSGAAGTERAA